MLMNVQEFVQNQEPTNFQICLFLFQKFLLVPKDQEADSLTVDSIE